MIGMLLMLFFLGVVTAQPPEGGLCECSIWMEFDDGLLHPAAGPLYPLALDPSVNLTCGLQVDCQKMCMDRMNYWADEEIESLNDTIPAGMPYEGDTWGDTLCRRSFQKYVDNGGPAERYPGAYGDPLWSWFQIDGCIQWRSVADHHQHPICCSDTGLWLPDHESCQEEFDL